MLVYALEQDRFIDTSQKEFDSKEFILATYCSLIQRFTLTLIGEKFDLCLHNEDIAKDEIALELFKQKDEKFKLHLDFFKAESKSA